MHAPVGFLELKAPDAGREDVVSAPATAPAQAEPGSEIRPFAAGDAAAVARLFHLTFRERGQSVPATLEGYLRSLFLEHPWRDPELPSLVYTLPRGAVGGFIGVLPVRMTLRGRPIRAAIAGSLMVEKPAEHPLAGARLLRSFFNGPQDLSFSESANPVSHGMWERLGGAAAPAYSLEWLRPLRPAGLAVALLSAAFRPAALLRPLGAGFDAIAGRIARNPLRLDSRPPLEGADITESELIRLVPRLAERYVLRPQWDHLPWMLGHAAIKQRHGELHRRVVYGRNRQPVGCHLYYGRPGGIGFVLQILAQPKSVEPVIDDLMAHAFSRGCVALRGRSQPDLLDALMRRQSVFLHRSSTVVHTRDPDVLAAIRSGDALLTGLAAESWTRLIGGTFA